MTCTRPSWHEYFMAVAKIISTRSTCTSRPVGCVLVKGSHILTTGYNGPPSGEPHCSDYSPFFCKRRSMQVQDSMKYEVCPAVHAERNACLRAEQLGMSLDGAICYTTLAPCINCTHLLAEKGVKEVYYETAYFSVDKERDAKWLAEARHSFAVFQQCFISDEIFGKFINALEEGTSQRRMPSA